jgi:hypothetical protein
MAMCHTVDEHKVLDDSRLLLDGGERVAPRPYPLQTSAYLFGKRRYMN